MHCTNLDNHGPPLTSDLITDLSVDPTARSDDDSSSRSDHNRTWSNDDRSRGDKYRACDAARLVHTEDAVDNGARFLRKGNEASN